MDSRYKKTADIDLRRKTALVTWTVNAVHRKRAKNLNSFIVGIISKLLEYPHPTHTIFVKGLFEMDCQFEPLNRQSAVYNQDFVQFVHSWFCCLSLLDMTCPKPCPKHSAFLYQIGHLLIH